MIEILDQPEAGSKRPFSGATVCNGFVFVSGRSAPHDPARGIFRGETPQEEVANSLSLIDSILQRAGASLRSVVQMTMLISNREDYDACNEEYVKHFPDGLPARHTVLFGVPTEARVGFACIAMQDGAAQD